MKKRSAFVVAVAVILSELALAPVAFAGGACSGHGGVNCSAGPDSDGSVICVDGWRGSSVSYSGTSGCSGYVAPAPAPEPEPTPSPEPVVEPAPAVIPVVTSTTQPAPEPAPAVKTTPTVAAQENTAAVAGSPESDAQAGEVTEPPTTEVMPETANDQPEDMLQEEPTAATSTDAESSGSPVAAAILVTFLGGLGYAGYEGVKFVKGKVTK